MAKVLPPIASEFKALAGDMAERFEAATRNVAYLCFRYGPHTDNPATGTAGGAWECAHASEYVRSATQEVADGDLFDLAKREQVPVMIPREPPVNHSLESLRRMVLQARLPGETE
ncbi:MAG: hypothetical protein ACREO8_08730 [Luteimonas sp.]